MATGNLFQGQARGKVGDVVFSVVGGKQVTRPYVERQHNPRTDKQLMQRAIFANFVKLLADGKRIYAQCIENVTDAQKALKKLATYSLKNYRNWIIATSNDHESGQDFVTGGYPVGVPSGAAESVAVPAAIVVSRGSLVQDVFNVPYVGNPDIFFSLRANESTPRAICSALNLRAGDTFTFVAQTVNDSIIAWRDEVTDLRVYQSYFDYFTIRVRQDAFTNDTEPSAMTWADIFEFVDASKASADLLRRLRPIDVLLPDSWTRGEKLDDLARYVGFAACIRSRGKLRSTAVMGGSWNFNTAFKSSGIPINMVPEIWRVS